MVTFLEKGHADLERIMEADARDLLRAGLSKLGLGTDRDVDLAMEGARPLLNERLRHSRAMEEVLFLANPELRAMSQTEYRE